MAEHNILGATGEQIAKEFLIGKGLKFVSSNYPKPYGEIDLIFKDISNKHIFIEVKSVSWETSREPLKGVPYETYKPEENVHLEKVKRLSRVIQAYLVSHEIEGEWQFDVLCVFLDQKKKIAKVRHLKNLILGS